MRATDESERVDPGRILAVKLADLGDLLTVTPALQALHAAYPRSKIDLLVPPSSVTVLQGASYLSRIIPFDKFAFDSLSGLANLPNLARTLRFLLSLRAARYDAVVLFHHLTLRFGVVKFTLLSLATGAPIRAGLDNGRGRFLTVRAPDNGFGAMHEVDYWLSVVALLGADAGAGWRPSLPVTSADRNVAAGLLAGFCSSPAGPVVAIHTGAGAYSPARIWPLGGFARVARGLIESHGARLVIVGGPDDIERARRLEASVGAADSVLNLAGRTNVHETAAVLELCDLLVGNDSGPMHLAATVGTPVVAIFGPSNQQAWRPYVPPGEPDPHRIVARDLPCMPCFYRGHSLGLKDGCGPRPCLTGLSPELVLAACREMLAGWAPGRRSRAETPTQQA